MSKTNNPTIRMKPPTSKNHLSHPFTAAGVLACAIFAGGVGHAEPDADPAVVRDDVVLKESIKREATRQDRVSAEIAALNKEFRSFAEEMESNKIYEEAKGDALVNAATKLDSTNEEYVSNAADKLREAAEQPANRKDAIAAAGGNIKGAIGELTELMELTEGFDGRDLLAKEVDQITNNQKDVVGKSTELGRELAEGKEPEARRFDELAAEQEKVAARTEKLGEMLRQAAKDTAKDAAKQTLIRATKALEENPAERPMRIAGKNIRESDMISAVGEQKEALKALDELAEALKKPEESDLAALKKSMEKILEEQEKLRERTEAMDKEEMAEKGADLQREQKELKDRLEELTKSEPMPKAPPSNNTEAKGPAPKKPSPPKEGEPKKGGAGKKGGGSNTGDGEETGKSPPRDRPPMPGTKPGTKPGGMGAETQEKAKQALAKQEKAEQALAQQNPESATAAQREAEQALSEALQQISTDPSSDMPPSDADAQPGVGEPGEAKPGEGKPGEGKPGAGKPGAGKPGKGAPGGTKPGKGSTGIASKNVYGTAPDDDQSTWQTLDEVDRAGLGENFARELPREYRDMLKAYYEKLAK